MDRFAETLKPMDAPVVEEIAKQLVQELQTKKKGVDLTKFDWGRTEFANPRDPRCLQGKCKGKHVIEPFFRGSSSGQNGHAMWLSCQQCKLRVLYTPRWGAKACFRSAGPLPNDVQEKINKTPENEWDPLELGTKALALEAAEGSALKQLTKIQQERAAVAKAKAKATPQSHTENVTKKQAKRDHAVSPEIQEGWTLTQASPAHEVHNVDP